MSGFPAKGKSKAQSQRSEVRDKAAVKVAGSMAFLLTGDQLAFANASWTSSRYWVNNDRRPKADAGNQSVTNSMRNRER
jgi:hypothetical protein